MVPAGFGLLWSALRVACILSFGEPQPPFVGYIIAPGICIIYASVIRGIKIVLFKIPMLKRFEEAVRLKIASKR